MTVVESRQSRRLLLTRPGNFEPPSSSTVTISDTNQKWPKTPDGTTDWELVFESPTSGFVPLIAQARTSEASGQCTKLIIHKLFTRDAYGAMVEKFIADLDPIVSGVSEAGELAKTSHFLPRFPEIPDLLTGVVIALIMPVIQIWPGLRRPANW